MQFQRRLIYIALAIATIVAGLSTRRHASALPKFIGEYAPDALWSVLVFWLVRLVAFGWPTIRIGAMTLFFSYAIEISQLYHAPWIESIRNTTLGGLILGFGFLWSDIACYTVGVLLAASVDFLIQRGFHPRRTEGD